MTMTIKDRHTACRILDKVYDFFVRELLAHTEALPELLFVHLTYLEEEDDIVTYYYIHILKSKASTHSFLRFANFYYTLEQRLLMYLPVKTTLEVTDDKVMYLFSRLIHSKRNHMDYAIEGTLDYRDDKPFYWREVMVP